MKKLLVVWPDNEREVWNVPPGAEMHFHDGNEKRPPRFVKEIEDVRFFIYGRIPQVTVLDPETSGPAGEVCRTFQ